MRRLAKMPRREYASQKGRAILRYFEELLDNRLNVPVII